MASILCLAHYCDTHGPTPLMVTEGFPVACSICFDGEELSTERPATGHQSSNKSLMEHDADFGKDVQHGSFSASSSIMDTPPDSPRVGSLQISRQSNPRRRDSSFRKTYDENDKKRLIPCENCALTLPKRVKSPNPEAEFERHSKTSRTDTGPILRTRKPYERISCIAGDFSPKSQQSDFDDTDKHSGNHPRRRSSLLKRSATSSSMSSFSSGGSQTHVHYLDYTSTHDPVSSTSFSILRASCLRTLSCETLPPSSVSPAVTSQTSAYLQQRAFQTMSTSAASTSGGPIFFGDPTAGYTTAFIFRIPDPYARGRRRVYAFMFLSTSRERAAMQSFSYLSAAFRDLAAWIQGLAEQEADRVDSEIASPATSSTSASPLLQSLPKVSSSIIDKKESKGDNDKGKENENRVTSAFLAGRLCDSDGFPSKGGSGIRSRGLAELVGRPDFFIELHARFVALLAGLAALAIS